MKSLKLYMRKNKLTKSEFARTLGVNYRSVYNWCRGASSPRVEMAIKIEEITGGEISVYSWK